MAGISFRFGIYALAFFDANGAVLRVRFLKAPNLKSFGPKGVIEKFKAYERGKRVAVKVNLSHLKPFTRKVLNEVSKIPFGQIKTYADIARALKSSPRAVGVALSKNPVPIIIPCHRVVSSSGLGGFSQGLYIKEQLLRYESEVKGESV